MNLTHGPFKGIEIGDGELRPLTNQTTDEIIQRDGKDVMIWGVHYRTQHVLEKFPPEEGWAIRVTNEPGPFNIPDPYTLVSDASGNQVPAMQPTVLFTAQLLGPKANVIAEASLLKVINSHWAWQSGQSSVRGALYDALGLSVSFDHSDSAEPTPTKGIQNQTQTASVVAGVSVFHGSVRESKLDPSAQVLLDQIGQDGTDEVAGEAVADSAKDAPTVTASEPSDAPVVPAEETPVVAAAASPKGKSAQVIDHPRVKDAPQSAPGLNANLVRQVQARAKLLRVPVPVFRDNDHLREFYKQLSSQSSSSASNVA